jgi:hypothetical protein
MPQVLIKIPYQSEEWEGLDVGDTYEASVLLTKQEDGSGLVTEVDGNPMPKDEPMEEEEMAMDEEEDFNDALGAEMA